MQYITAGTALSIKGDNVFHSVHTTYENARLRTIKNINTALLKLHKTYDILII